MQSRQFLTKALHIYIKVGQITIFDQRTCTIHNNVKHGIKVSAKEALRLKMLPKCNIKETY